MDEVDQEKKKTTWPPRSSDCYTMAFLHVEKRVREKKKKKTEYADTARVTYVIRGTDFTRLQRQ